MKNWRSAIAPRQRRIAIMRLVDRIVPIHPGRVTFVAKKSFGVSGNIRVVADAMAEHLERDVHLYFEGTLDSRTRRSLQDKSIRIWDRFDAESAQVLASSALIVVDHSIRDCYISSPKPGRRIANIWHGVPIKGIELSMLFIDDTRRRRIEESGKLYDWMLASSAVDRLAISASFGISPNKVFPFGLPRYDLLRDDYPLPADLLQLEQNIVAGKGDKKLLLYAPTFRESSPSPFAELLPRLDEVSDILAELGIALGVRPHPYDKIGSSLHGREGLLAFTNEVCPETNLLLKHTDILVTDFSSLWVDFLLLRRPILGYATNSAEYERGFLYSFATVFPGVFCEDLNILLDEIRSIQTQGHYQARHDYQEKLFLPQSSSPVTHDVVNHLCALLEQRYE